MDETAAQAYRLNFIKGVAGQGLSPVDNIIIHGRNSGYQAIGLAVDQGAADIALVGFDMKPANGRLHWFGNHPQGFKTPNFAAFLKGFPRLAADAQQRSIRIVNCSPISALTCFPKTTLQDWLNSPNT